MIKFTTCTVGFCDVLFQWYDWYLQSSNEVLKKVFDCLVQFYQKPKEQLEFFKIITILRWNECTFLIQAAFTFIVGSSGWLIPKETLTNKLFNFLSLKKN